jgi:hypothetical protein
MQMCALQARNNIVGDDVRRCSDIVIPSAVLRFHCFSYGKLVVMMMLSNHVHA